MTNPATLVPVDEVAFDAFHLDVARHRLWRGKHEITLRPKSWDVLCYLVARPGLLVTKATLHREIWPDTAVSDDALTKVIAELRQTLGDSSRAPRLIETVHGRGFRFIATIKGLENATLSTALGGGSAPPTPVLATGDPRAVFVGRQPDLSRLFECLQLAHQGERQIVFVTGEAGIGKTTLTDEFVRAAALREPTICFLHGRCIQQHGQREPYMPVLEALERVLSSAFGGALVPLFRRTAPCWYVQIPKLLAEGEPAGFQGAMMTAPPQRMLREIGAFLESMAADSTVALVLEDLHWSDHATTDFLSFMAERRDPARLLIVGTYRPAEASTRDHPIREVRRTLRAHGRCVDLALDYLSIGSVREYLQRRFGDRAQDLAPLVHARTDGNPLFVVAIVEELIRRDQLTSTRDGWVVKVASDPANLAVPSDLVEMFTAQFQNLTAEERAVLEAASVAGPNFTPWTVARALGRDIEHVEATAQHMAWSHLFLRAASPEANSKLAANYDFAHALHHQVIYEQIPDGRRRRLHQAIGEALEARFGERRDEIAPALSAHFERSGDDLRAVNYLRVCMSRAQQRLAYREAVAYGRNALNLLDHLPRTPDRGRLELELRLMMGVPLHFMRGYASPEVGENYERAGELCADVGDAQQLFEIVHSVLYAQSVASELDAAMKSVDELTRIAAQYQVREFSLRAELARGRTECWKGNFREGSRILTRFLEEIERNPIETREGMFGVEPAIPGFAMCGLASWFLGRPDQARTLAGRGLAYAEETRHPFSVASALVHSAILELLCRDWQAAADLAARAAQISTTNDFSHFAALSRFLRGAALAEQGNVDHGLPEMLGGLIEHRSVTGRHVNGLMLAFIATARARAGRWEEALQQADEGIALADATPECFYAAELWRVKGELLLGTAPTAKREKAARECFQRALEIARGQAALSLELRSAMSLARVEMRQSTAHEDRERLRSLYASFTEGFDTRDLRDARALLKELETDQGPRGGRHQVG